MMKQNGLKQRGQNIGGRSGRVALALFLLTSMSIFCGSCGTAPVENKTQSQTQRYALKGTVTAIERPTREIVVNHEAIPGFMGAMEMPYPVKDVESLDKIAPGRRDSRGPGGD